MRLRNQDFYEEYVFTCNRCKSCTITDDARCLSVCPSYDLYEFFTDCAGGKAHIAQKILQDSARMSPELCEAVYRCLLCQACKVGCPVTIDTYLLIRDMREAMVAKGWGPMPRQKDLLTSLATHGHPYGGLQGGRGEWAKGLNIKDAAKEPCEFLLFAGCSAGQGQPTAQVPATAARLLRKAGLDLGALGDREQCCGAIAAEMGDRKLFLSLAKENIASLKLTGAHTIITTCPSCHAFLKKEYQDDDGLGWPPEIDVLHITEMLARSISEGRLTPSRETVKKVTYHDPCHLGRHADVYDAPREIIKAIPGIEFVEMERNRENAYCCGRGTGVHEAFQAFSEATVAERLREAGETGAEMLITACPHCLAQFQAGLKCANEPGSLEVMDLLKLVDASTG